VRLSIRYPSVFSHLRMPTTETLYSGIDPAAPAGWMSRNGVRDELGLSEDTLVLGSVANFTVHKAHVYLIHAMARVLRVFPEARLVLVGSGPLEGNVRRKVRDLKLDNTVIFTGSRPDAARLASGFDVFVLSSIQEGLSIALLEAMALGKPAVVTGVGGLKEVLQDGKQGFLVPPADSRALAGALITLLTDDALRTQFGEAARVRANQFDVRLAVRRTEQVYEELLS